VGLGISREFGGAHADECRRIEEDNAEFHLAMLDRRFLDGNASLFEKLDAKVMSGPEKQARPFLLTELQRLTRDRLNRYGNTIFHLEPMSRRRQVACATTTPHCGCGNLRATAAIRASAP